MGNAQWPFRLTIGIVFALIIIGYTFFEASRYYDFVQGCHCGSQAIYYADRTGYIVGEVAVAAVWAALVAGAALVHPLLGILALSGVFGITGLAHMWNGSSQEGYAAISDMASYYAYLRMLGRNRLVVGGVCGIGTILAVIGFIITSRREQQSADKGQIT